MSDLAVRGISGHHGHGGGRTEARDDANRPPLPGGVTAARGDQVSLSPDALARALAEVEDSDSGAVTERGQPLVRGRMRGLIHNALNGLRRDLAHLMKGFGFAPDVANQFAKAFIEPVVAAIKAGVGFAAELTIAAFSQTTEVSESGFSQTTSLFVKSLTIEVNQNTGEVSVGLASLSFHQQIEASFGDPEPPLLTLGPGPVAPPPEPEEDAAETPLEGLLRQVQERLAFDAVRLDAIIAVRLLELFENDAGDPIARLLLDAEVPLNPAGDEGDDPDPSEAAALDVNV